jgi:O-antigen/teichoic acid export membrane protein
MNLKRAITYSSLATASKMMGILVLNKILAITIGPSGYAVLGQFQNFLQIAQVFGSAGFNNGVVKYTAQYSRRQKRQIIVWSTSIYFTIFCSLVVGAIIFSASSQIAKMIQPNLTPLNIKILAISIVFISLNFLMLSILNGLNSLARYALMIASNTLISLIVVSIGAVYWGISGALNSLSVFHIVCFFVNILVISSTKSFRLSRPRINWMILKRLFSFSIMTVASVLCMPLALIVLRGIVSQDLGVEYAGYWEGMWRFSMAFMMLFTTTLSVYFLPRFSKANKSLEIRKELVIAVKYIFPIIIILSLLSYYFRSFIISFLFSYEFIAMEQLFGFQLAGDTIKFLGWMFGYLLIAKAQAIKFITLEILFSISFLVISVYFLRIFGFVGLSQGYLINNTLYLISVLYVSRSFYLERG